MRLTGTERFILTIVWLIAIAIGFVAIYQEAFDLGVNYDYNQNGKRVQILLPNMVDAAVFGAIALLLGCCAYGYQTPATGATWQERLRSEKDTTLKILMSFGAASFICSAIERQHKTALSILYIGLLCAVGQVVLSMVSAWYHDTKRDVVASELPEGVTSIGAKEKPRVDDPMPEKTNQAA